MDVTGDENTLPEELRVGAAPQPRIQAPTGRKPL